MSSLAAPRCGHIKVNGTQCGSPAQRNERFCYFHQHSRPITFAFGRRYHDYSSSEVILPAFEDAHSIQLTLRQVTELILRHKIDDKTAGLVLYALQIASSNLKRMELEKPQPEQVVIDLETESETPIAAITEAETAQQTSDEEINRSDEDLPTGTIQACYRPGPLHRKHEEAEGNSRSSHLLRDGDGVSIPVFEGEFPHTVELVGNRHGDFRAGFLNAIEDSLQAVHFHVEGQACADGRG